MDIQVNGGKKEIRGVYRASALKDVEDVDLVNGNVLIQDTNTEAEVGAIIRYESGDFAGKEYKVIDVPDANHFLLATDDLPAVADTFYHLRYVTPRYASDGTNVVSVTPVTYSPVDKAFINASSTNVTDSAYVELDASAAANVSEIEVHNSTGVPMFLATGAALSESNQLIIPSNGLERQQFTMASGTRLSLKTLTGETADSGYIIINMFG